MSWYMKVVTIAVVCVLIVFFTMFGVIAAHKVSTMPLGSTVEIDGLDRDGAQVGMVNILLIGVDDDGTRSDTIMLFSVDGYSNRINVLSLPRDTRILLNGYHQKLNAAMGAGIEAVKQKKAKEPEEILIQEVKELTGLPVNYFMTVDFDGFMDIIEAVDGVEFNVPYDMDYDDPVQGLHIHLKAGQQHLNGQQAHDFVRFRHNNDGSAPGEYIMGDEGRIYWQQEFMKELIRQKLKPQYLSKLTDVFDAVMDNVRTNYTMQDLLAHVKMIQNLDPGNISTNQLPGEYEYFDDLWWYVYDEEKTYELIDELFMPKSSEDWEKQKASSTASAKAASTSPASASSRP